MNTKNLFETLANAQKQAAETFASATEQMQKTFMNGMNNSDELSSDYFKKWYDSQMEFFNKANDAAKENFSKNAGNANAQEFFGNWMNEQQNLMKNWYEFNTNLFKNHYENNSFSADANNDARKAYDAMTSIYNQWMETAKNTYADMTSNFKNNTTGDAFGNLFNNADMYMKAYQFWMPFMKSINDKTFTPDSFKKAFNAEMYKEMMDKLFNLSPDFIKEYTEKNKAMYTDVMNKWNSFASDFYNKGKQNFYSNAPDMNAFFSNASNSYNEFYNFMQKAASPLMRMMPGGPAQEQTADMNQLAHDLNDFLIKNTQMQYAMYETGVKATETAAEQIAEKIKNGESFDNFSKLYLTWLNTIDANYVKYFETEEYSQLQADVTSLGFRLKKQMDNGVEKMLVNLPLINRTEMDELYKTIQDLKKKVHTLEKELAATKTAKTETKNTAAATATNTTTTAAPKAKTATAPKATAAKATTAKKASSK